MYCTVGRNLLFCFSFKFMVQLFADRILSLQTPEYCGGSG